MSMVVALVATVKNEAEQLPRFLESILRQTRKPDFIVITSATSDDRTEVILQEFEDTHYEDGVIWLPVDGGNRSFGRNEAIRHAMEEGADIIACTNVCVLDPEWFEQIVAPIESGDYFGYYDVVGGGYRIDARTPREKAAASVTQYTQEEAARKGHITALSMAFRVEAWKDVGGFPEELDTSEDTVFVERLRTAGFIMGYNPNAVVTWRPSTLTLRGAYRTYKQFAETDAKARVKPMQYVATLFAYVVPLLLLPVSWPIAGLLFWTWLMYRIRKVGWGLNKEIPALGFVVAVDLARIKGYFGEKSWRQGEQM